MTKHSLLSLSHHLSSLMKYVSFSILALVLFACSEKEVRVKPSYVLAEDTMAIMMADLGIFNAELQHRDVRKDKLQNFVLEENQSYLDSIGISQERWDSSFAWYSKDLVLMQDIQDEALNILNAKLEEIKTKKRTVPEPKAHKSEANSID